MSKVLPNQRIYGKSIRAPDTRPSKILRPNDLPALRVHGLSLLELRIPKRSDEYGGLKPSQELKPCSNYLKHLANLQQRIVTPRISRRQSMI